MERSWRPERRRDADPAGFSIGNDRKRRWQSRLYDEDSWENCKSRGANHARAIGEPGLRVITGRARLPVRHGRHAGAIGRHRHRSRRKCESNQGNGHCQDNDQT